MSKRERQMEWCSRGKWEGEIDRWKDDHDADDDENDYACCHLNENFPVYTKTVTCTTIPQREKQELENAGNV